jgi:hypothetical protein
MEEVVEAKFSVGDDRGFEAETASAHFGKLVRVGEQNPVIGSNIDKGINLA